MPIQELEDLPKNEKEFTVDVEKGDTTSERFKGKFKCVCVQTLKQKAEADLMRARLNGALPTSLNDDTKMFHLCLSELHNRLLSAPKWFNEASFGADLKDLNVMVAIFNECIEAEREWRIAVWGPPKKASTIEETEENKEEPEGAAKT
jgi:hypothetical protein